MGITHRHRSGVDRRATLVTTRRLEGQRGASLVIALCMLLVLGVLLSAVLAYANTNFRVSNTYRKQRVDRYAGDGAVEAAINYVRGQGLMGRDPSYAASDPPCVYNVPTDAGTIAVTCKADPGKGSGLPTDTGLVPNQAILATGARQTEVGPMNQNNCYANLQIAEIGQPGEAEQSIFFQQGVVRDYFEETVNPFNFCKERNRSLNQFTVRGNIVAAGRVAGEGSVSLQPTLVGGVSTPSSLKARFGCAIQFSPGSCGTPTASEYADPGAWSNGQAVTAWRNVPLNTVTRSSGYKVDQTKLTGRPEDLTPTSSCGPQDTIILLPGYYPNANTINQFTANGVCKESTIWLAPEAGDDGILMTDDDKTGAYYFGFTNGNTDWRCSNIPAQSHRLCIGGGGADSSPRVVAGTPDGWNPLAIAGSTTPRTITMSKAQTVDSGLSQTWSNGAGAREIGTADNANPASYSATACLFGICISSNRSIRLRDFAPQVAQGPDAGAKLLKIEVSHRETGTMDEPRVELRTVSPESGNRTCPGLYRLPTNSTGALRVDELTYTADATAPTAAKAQAAAAACLDSADRINGLQMTFRWTGNPFNSGSPRVYLDGARVSFQSTPGASFPVAGTGGPAAVIDCDKTKAGAQLIFGGDSHAYVPDGSLEVCAGPYPTSPGDHQQIAVYGRPAVTPLVGTTMGVAAYENADNVSASSIINARDIAEVPSRLDATVNFRSTNNCSGVCAWTRQYSAVTRSTMAAYPAADYPGLEVDKVTARVTYNSKNTKALEFIETDNLDACRAWTITKLVLSFGFAEGTNCARSTLKVGSCLRDAPLTGDLRSWDVDVTGCVTQAQLESGSFQTEWISRADHLRFCFIFCSDFGSKSASHQLDGVELLVGLRRTSGSTAIVPQSGCNVDFPNYWEGVGNSDCAIVKADSLRPNNLFSNEADWVGRLSIQGTVYAPSAAFEIDELDSAYSLASRGLVVRHLRVKGFRNRAGYVTPVIDTQLDTTPAAREATFVACKRGAGRSAATTPCSKADGDRILTKARVRFEYAASTPTTWTPKVVWWTDNR